MAKRGAPLDPLRKDLKKGTRPFYLFTGQQHWILDEALSLLRTTLKVDSVTGMDYRILDAQSRWEDVEALLRNYSFFDGVKLVHFEIPKKISVEFRDFLNAFLEESPGPNILCLTAPSLSQVMAAKNRISKGGGLALAFAELKGDALEDWTHSCLKAKGLDFDPEVPKCIMDRLPVDPGDIAAEIDKLSLVVGPGGRLSVAQVELLVAYQPQLDIFRLTDSLRPGNEKRILVLLGELLESGEHSPIPLIAMLASTMAQVLKARILLDQRLPERAILERMGGHPFAAGKALNRARKGSRREFVSWIMNLQKLDVKLRRVPADRARTLIETYLLESLSARILSS